MKAHTDTLPVFSSESYVPTHMIGNDGMRFSLTLDSRRVALHASITDLDRHFDRGRFVPVSTAVMQCLGLPNCVHQVFQCLHAKPQLSLQV